MQAYHNDFTIKEKYLARVKAHRVADNLVQGFGWNGKKGCAVGCTVENYNHASYEKELGIPRWLARVEDAIFEGLEKTHAMAWPEKFLSAIHVGADLEKVKKPFFIFLLTSALKKIDHNKYKEQADSIKKVIKLYKKNCKDLKQFQAAAVVADVAADAAYAVIAYAAGNAAHVASYAAYVAGYTDYVIGSADYADFVVKIVHSAVGAAAASAADAAYGPYSSNGNFIYRSEEKNEYKKVADKLIALLKKCK